MERSEIPGPASRSFPEFAALHPGYDFLLAPFGLFRWQVSASASNRDSGR
jgi:hypothetical protein